MSSHVVFYNVKLNEVHQCMDYIIVNHEMRVDDEL